MQALHSHKVITPEFRSYKNLAAVAFCATLLIPGLSSATGLNNGDFATNDFSSWSIDTDGFSGSTPDFQIIPSGSDSHARIEADYWSESGNTASTPQDFVFFANTLYQAIDLTASANKDLVLSFDYEYRGENLPNDENFLVALGDGTGDYYGADGGLGFLLNTDSYDSANFSITLDNSFNNLLDWTLEFQLNSGFDGYGSFVNIDNVSLEAVDRPGAVPVPAAVWLFASGLLGLLQFRSKRV